MLGASGGKLLEPRLRTMGYQNHEARIRQLVSQHRQEIDRFLVSVVNILQQKDRRLALAQPREQGKQRIVNPRAARLRLKAAPFGVVTPSIEASQQRHEMELCIETEVLQLCSHSARGVVGMAVVDLEELLQKVGKLQPRQGRAIGQGSGLENQAPLGSGGSGELIAKPGFSPPRLALDQDEAAVASARLF